MMIALGILIALGLAVIIMMFREQKAPVVNVEATNWDDPIEALTKILQEQERRRSLEEEEEEEAQPEDDLKKIYDMLQNLTDKGTDAEPVPAANEGPTGTTKEIPPKVVETPVAPPVPAPIDVPPIDHAKPMPHPREDNLEELSARLVDLYFSNHEPGQKFAIEEEQHNVLLRIKAKLRYMEQDRLKDNPIRKEAPRKAAPRPIM